MTDRIEITDDMTKHNLVDEFMYLCSVQHMLISKQQLDKIISYKKQLEENQLLLKELSQRGLVFAFTDGTYKISPMGNNIDKLLENEKIVERLKLKIGQYHGKTNYEDYDELLQSILGEK